MVIAMISPLFAAENIGVPQDYQMIFQDAMISLHVIIIQMLHKKMDHVSMKVALGANTN